MRDKMRTVSQRVQPTNSLGTSFTNNNKRSISQRVTSYKGSKNERRISSIKNMFIEESPVLNPKPMRTTSVQETLKRKQKIDDNMNRILKTTQIYAGEDKGNISARQDFIKSIKDQFTKDELVDMFDTIINKLDDRQKANLRNNRSANS